ncbi:MAG: glycosyltransferase family 4 protein, partial [Desulfuromonadales bacterium]|nr:glycosyltransferase family 4 protein [Desulfuromonadales bacterium]
MADVIVVGSPFCAQTMIDNGCPEEKIRIVPYGFDETLFPAVPPQREPPEGRPMRFLFVGAVHARKGAAYLLQAFQDIPQ